MSGPGVGHGITAHYRQYDRVAHLPPLPPNARSKRGKQKQKKVILTSDDSDLSLPDHLYQVPHASLVSARFQPSDGGQNPALVEENNEAEAKKQKGMKNGRMRNPCQLCKVGFFHGAVNFAIIGTGLHFFLMFYCICILLFTKDYTLGFLQFWGINRRWDDNSEETRELLYDVYLTSVVGCVSEIMGLVIGLGLLYGIVAEKPILCRIWCVLSTMIIAIELFGVAFLATRLSFIVLIPIPFAVLIQAFGLWVILSYVRSLGEKKLKCPMCHQELQDAPISDTSDTSEPMPETAGPPPLVRSLSNITKSKIDWDAEWPENTDKHSSDKHSSDTSAWEITVTDEESSDDGYYF